MLFFLCRTKWIKIGMIEYRCGDGVVLGADVNKDLPVIGKIIRLYAIDDN